MPHPGMVEVLSMQQYCSRVEALCMQEGCLNSTPFRRGGYYPCQDNPTLHAADKLNFYMIKGKDEKASMPPQGAR